MNKPGKQLAKPPVSIAPPEAERSVVGSILLAGSRAVCDQATITGLRGVDFIDRNLGKLYDCLVLLIEAGKPIDATTLLIELPGLGVSRDLANARVIVELIHAVPNAAHCHYYAQAVASAGKRRRLTATLQQALTRLTTTEDETASVAGDLRADLAIVDTKSATVETIHQGAMRGVDRLEEQLANPDAAVSLARTGITALDQTTGRLRAGSFVVVGGRTGTGKTVLGVQTALTTAKHGGRAIYFSMEMTADELGLRVASAEGTVDVSQIMAGNGGELPLLRDAAAQLEPLPFLVCDLPSITVDDVTAVARYHHTRAPLSLIVVDYLQLISLQRGEHDRRLGLERVSRSLKQLAKELGVPVMALAQLSRQAEGETPRLSHLRETGAIEQDADMVILLDRPGKDADGRDDQGRVEVIIRVAKNRIGPEADVKALFAGRFSRFEEPALGSPWAP